MDQRMNMRLLWFESFQRHQEQLEATNLLKLQDMEPTTRYYVEAKLNDKLEWTEWAYDRTRTRPTRCRR